jgi:hypothetical protein
MTTSVEVWKPVVGYEGLYEVSDHGRVRSLRNRRWCGSHWYEVPISAMKATIARNGYPVVRLTKEGRGRTVAVHTIVLTAFCSSKPAGQECRHLNGNPQDSRLCNLAWGTPLENTEDRKRHGTMPQGPKHHAAKLTIEQVLKIRTATGAHREIAQRYGIAASAVSTIKSRKSWSWL